MVKRKILSLVLVLCVLCMCAVFSGCEEEVKTNVNDAVKKTQELDSMHAVMKMEMDMEAEGMSLSIPLTADMKATGLQSGKPVSSSVITMSMLGMDTKIEAYQEGEWMYIAQDDMKYKVKADDAEYDYSDDAQNMVQTIPEELLKNVETKTGKNGSTTVTVTIPDELFEEVYGDFLDGINAESGMVDGDISIRDAVVQITILNGYVSSYDMQFGMDVTVAEVVTKTTVKANIEYKNPGEKVTPTPPQGYQDFEELDIFGDLEDWGEDIEGWEEDIEGWEEDIEGWEEDFEDWEEDFENLLDEL